ncbi:hypothetical protein [Flavobacterium sp.]|uniref:hypothetical protein n=1 Tax=Flavobacterium sp. TaxID=239 RepID=UPI003750BCEC
MELIKKYLPFLLYSCRRVSEIISKDDDEITLQEKLILLYHGTICRTCQHYKIQSGILESSISKSLVIQKENKLSKSKKEEIVLSLNKIKI